MDRRITKWRSPPRWVLAGATGTPLELYTVGPPPVTMPRGENHMFGGLFAGATLGALVGGPVGAIVGGFVGGVAAIGLDQRRAAPPERRHH